MKRGSVYKKGFRLEEGEALGARIRPACRCWLSSILSHSVVSDFATPWQTVAHQAPLSMGFSRQEYWSRCHALLQGIFSTQGLNLCLLHWQADFSPLSYLGSLLTAFFSKLSFFKHIICVFELIHSCFDPGAQKQSNKHLLVFTFRFLDLKSDLKLLIRMLSYNNC